MLVLTVGDFVLGVFESLDKLPEPYREKFTFTVKNGSVSNVIEEEMVTLWHVSKLNTLDW